MGRLSQYSEQYKLAVVEHYQNTSDGYKLTARHFGLDHATVRTWVKAYQQHGLKGLQPTHGYYSQSFKLTVVQDILHNQLSICAAAFKYNVPYHTTVAAWLKRYAQQGLHGLAVRRAQPGRLNAVVHRTLPKPLPKVPETPSANQRLQAQLQFLQAENAYLKKLYAFTLAQERCVRKTKPG